MFVCGGTLRDECYLNGMPTEFLTLFSDVLLNELYTVSIQNPSDCYLHYAPIEFLNYFQTVFIFHN